MITVGVRELRNRLSLYLKAGCRGPTDQGYQQRGSDRSFDPSYENRELIALVEEGLASWAGGKPQGASRPVKDRGRPLSEIIIEDRR